MGEKDGRWNGEEGRDRYKRGRRKIRNWVVREGLKLQLVREEWVGMDGEL